MINKMDTMSHKIKSFFIDMFNSKDNLEPQNIHRNNIAFREQFQEDRIKKDLAEKLLDGKVDVYDLEDAEVEEMTEYFIRDNEAMDIELARIKAHILTMQKQLKNM